MKTTNKKTLEEIIRVDHAGERGAIKIYEGQLLALNTFKKNEKLKKLIEARDKPKNLKVTSLQLIVFCFNCFKRSSFDRI